MYTNLETNARHAKTAYSFWEYKPGTATAEYEEYCNKADKIAEEAKAKLTKASAPADRSEKVDYLLQRYKAKKLEWMNELYTNQAQVPSIMISGGSNFPAKAKERQNARESKLWKENPDYILDKIRAIGNDSATIRIDEQNAAERIKAKIARLETMPDPYGNKKAEIRRLKGRLFDIAPEEFKSEQQNISVNGAKTYEEILALFSLGKVSRSPYDPENPCLYYDLYLDFYNGKRHYREILNFTIDEKRENLIRIGGEMLPLTNENKYKLIINKIYGTGGKAVMYNHLKGLLPKVETEPAEELTTITINGESAEVKRNKDIMRLQIIFDGKPSDETRAKLKESGFRWAPSVAAWQRLLNNNSEYALKRMIAK